MSGGGGAENRFQPQARSLVRKQNQSGQQASYGGLGPLCCGEQGHRSADKERNPCQQGGSIVSQRPGHECAPTHNLGEADPHCDNGKKRHHDNDCEMKQTERPPAHFFLPAEEQEFFIVCALLLPLLPGLRRSKNRLGHVVPIIAGRSESGKDHVSGRGSQLLQPLTPHSASGIFPLDASGTTFSPRLRYT